MDNETPMIIEQTASFSIPNSTPFYLEASATQNNDNGLSYCWEQIDNELAAMPPESTSFFGPCFRSFEPQTSSRRYFPSINNILNGANGSAWERLPAVERDLNFNLTVRSVNETYGCTTNGITTIAVTDASGPFLLQSLNTSNIQWNGGSNKIIEWDVANTDLEPVLCDSVSILLSTDGGQNFDITIATVVNNGSTEIVVPAVNSTKCRIMIKCANNIFFDINNRDFEIINVLSGSASITNDIKCNSGNEGEISIIAENGTPPYTYSLDGENYQMSNVFTELTAGSYTPSIKDAESETIVLNEITLNEPEIITIALDITPNQMIINAEGGTGTYSYSIDGVNYSSIKVITISDGTTYTVHVQDENGCIAVLEEFTYYYISDIQVSTNNVACKGTLDGFIIVDSVIGGKEPYQYILNGGMPTNESSFVYLSGGEYTLEVIDSENNTFSIVIEILEAEIALDMTYTIEDLVATITPTGGIPPYQYSLEGQDYQSENVISDLSFGVNNIYVKDSLGCTIFESFAINSIEEQRILDKINIYPNPVNDVINIEIDNESNVDFTIYTIDGKSVNNGSINAKNSISVDGLASGLYFIKFQKGTASRSVKFEVIR